MPIGYKYSFLTFLFYVSDLRIYPPPISYHTLLWVYNYHPHVVSDYASVIIYFISLFSCTYCCFHQWIFKSDDYFLSLMHYPPSLTHSTSPLIHPIPTPLFLLLLPSSYHLESFQDLILCTDLDTRPTFILDIYPMSVGLPMSCQSPFV